MAIQIQLRRGTASEWSSANPTLAQGEVGLELDTNKTKIGSGFSAWNSLPYSGATAAGLGLGNVDNTSDANKPVSTAQSTANTTVQNAAASDATSKANARGDVFLTAVQTLTSKTFTGFTETVFTVIGTTPTLSVANGTIQTWTLTGNSTPTDSLTTGQAITLLVDDGAAFTITWPSVVWKTGGGVAPTLNTTGYTVIVLWDVAGVLYGARVGDA